MIVAYIKETITFQTEQLMNSKIKQMVSYHVVFYF